MEGTNKAHENGEAMGFVGVRLTVMLGHGYLYFWLHFIFYGVLAFIVFDDGTLADLTFGV